jgi:hypothetical protein
VIAVKVKNEARTTSVQRVALHQRGWGTAFWTSHRKSGSSPRNGAMYGWPTIQPESIPEVAVAPHQYFWEHVAMPTYYRPTERRGKCVVYMSTDLAEPKREIVKGIATFAGFGLFLAVLWLSSR